MTEQNIGNIEWSLLLINYYDLFILSSQTNN